MNPSLLRRALPASSTLLVALLALSSALTMTRCSGGVELECTIDSECAEDQVCTIDNVCELRNDYCTSEAQCPADQSCVLATNTCESDGKKRCERKDDCPGALICNTRNGQCEEERTEDFLPCTEDDECRRDERCLSGFVPSERVCRQPRTCEEAEDIDVFCREQQGAQAADYWCDLQDPAGPVCAEEPSYSWILIQDVSAGVQACDTSLPGTDLLGVKLVDNAGNLLGWGAAGPEGIVGSTSFDPMGNLYQDAGARLNGQANGFGPGQQCPDPGVLLGDLMPEPLALGCLGWILIEFHDTNGTPIRIRRGSRIEVLEYGVNCGGAGADLYDVYTCQGENPMDRTVCKQQLGVRTSGFGEFPITR